MCSSTNISQTAGFVEILVLFKCPYFGTFIRYLQQQQKRGGGNPNFLVINYQLFYKSHKTLFFHRIFLLQG